MSEIDEAKYRRAKEVLETCGWLFDDYCNAEMAKILTSAWNDPQSREEAFRKARVATEMKIGLEGLVNGYEADKKLAEKKEAAATERAARLNYLKEHPDGYRYPRQ